jgi:glycosyltransferase involved in cell wall biosynthesis
MACGKPAVVFSEGGGTESMVPGRTGVVFHEPTPEALRAAVDSLDRIRFNASALRAQAESYCRTVFESRFRDFVERARSTATDLRTNARW